MPYTMNRNLKQICMIVAVGLVLNLLFLLLYHYPHPKRLVGDEAAYYLSANLIINDPAAAATRYPFWPPLYTGFLSVLFRWLGAKEIFVQAIQIMMLLVAGLCWHEITRKLTDSSLAAKVTLAMFLCYPNFIAFSHYLWPEIAHLFLFSVALWLLISYPTRISANIGTGFLIGLALLTKSLLLLFFPVMLVYLARNCPAGRQRLAGPGIICLVVLLMLLPTMVKNHREYGSYMLADNLVINLWLGLTDRELVDHRNDLTGDAIDQYKLSGDSIDQRHRVYRAKMARLVSTKGVSRIAANQLGKQYFRLLGHDSFFTSQLLYGSRWAYSSSSAFIANLLRGYSYLFYGLLIIAGVLGLFMLRFMRGSWLQLILIFLLYNLLLFLFFHAKTRYRIQFMPVLMLSSGVAIQWLFSKRHTIKQVLAESWERRRRRLVLSFISAGLLVFIAFFDSF